MVAGDDVRYLSVCSGIEAASVAWHQLSWTPVAFSEIEPFPCAVLAHHYPSTPNWGDMTKFKEWPDADIDLLVGGTPCQSFSVAGLRKGLADPRGNLMLTYLAIADRYRPEWVVWENVPGVLSSNGGRDFGAFIGGLAELGYGWSYRVLDAQYFGVAQRRRRVFVVGHLGDWRRAAAVLFERHSLSGHPAPRREKRKEVTCDVRSGVAGTLGSHKSGGWGSIDTDSTGDFIPEVVGTLSDGAHMGGGGRTGRTPIQAELSRCLNAGGMGRQDYETETLIPVGGFFDVAHSLTNRYDSSEDGCGRGTPLVPVHAFYARQHDALQYGDKTGPLDTDGHTMAVQQRMSARRLTPRECERLQGFPDDYTLVTYRNKPAADGPRYKALGNSMAVPVMRWIGWRIAQVQNIPVEGEPHE